MRIAINTRFLLSKKMEGFGWFTYEVVKRMVIQHPEHDFYFFFDRKFDPKFVFADNVTPLVVNPPARHPILFKIWFDYAITRALKKHKIDLFFSPDGYVSLKTNVTQIGVIHDLNFEHYPEDIPKAPSQYLKKHFPLFAKKAEHIITVSHFSKQDIITQYNIDSDKITVAHNGGSDLFKPLPETIHKSIKDKYTNGNPFFVYVGALHARKNTDRLFTAFNNYKINLAKTHPTLNYKLIVIGEKLWSSEATSTHFENLDYKADIIFTGHLPITELVNIVGSARALTLVSYFEGFGIPLVEAMRCGVPVITSNVTSLPEVAGDCGVLVDPFDINSIEEALLSLTVDDDLHTNLSKKSIDRAKLFSWDKSASIIWDVIEKYLKKRFG